MGVKCYHVSNPITGVECDEQDADAVRRFIVNNGGYTVERLIHGMDALYNTIPVWKYEKLSEVFGPDHPSRYDRIETGAELVELLNYGRFSAADCTQVCFKSCLADLVRC